MPTDPDCPDVQEDNPGERAGPNIIKQAPSGDPVAPLAGTPAVPRAKVLPTALPFIVLIDLPNDIGD